MVQSQIAVHILVIISGSGCGTISGTNWPYQVKKCNIQERNLVMFYNKIYSSWSSEGSMR